jgi:hypothetical protein
VFAVEEIEMAEKKIERRGGRRRSTWTREQAREMAILREARRRNLKRLAEAEGEHGPR